MALADILNRIGADAAVEAQAVLDAARAEADQSLAEARTRAGGAADGIERATAREASLTAETLLANARLEARDALLVAKRGVLDSALAVLGERIVALPDADYTAFLASAIVGAARGGERVLVATADAGRLEGLQEAVKAAAQSAGRTLTLEFGGEKAAVAHGVVLLGTRDSVDLSVNGIIGAQRETLLMRLASLIFVDEGTPA
ncbi:MAG: V-type ATP synthase subunit E [Actinomycetota bacterium]|nr:V-type ATP synthase subunit E [Actinomycetota bacterium]MDP3630751.1 V-type ATP synthase subunit E [Actinomycetota bacterium]